MAKFYLLETSYFEIGQMRVSDLFARGQIDENNPSGLSSKNRVRMVVLKSRSSSLVQVVTIQIAHKNPKCYILI
jgi:hypothetical protein